MKALLGAWLVANVRPKPPPVFTPGVCRKGTVKNLPMRPGPQGHNGGITPGFKPEEK